MRTQSIQPLHLQASARPAARRTRHSWWTITLHWASVAAILLATTAILWRELIDDEPLRVQLMDLHRQAGLFVLAALGLRLLVRFGVGMADHAGEMPALMRWAARGAHLALYVMLLALPVVGWAASNAHAVRVKLFGLLTLPSLVGDDPDLADTLTDIHLWMSWGLLLLVVAHAGAACWHHYVRRDGVLAAMLPMIEPQKKN
jgi:cytochrome b561